MAALERNQRGATAAVVPRVKPGIQREFAHGTAVA